MISKCTMAELGPSLLRPAQEECESHFLAVYLAYDLST